MPPVRPTTFMVINDYVEKRRMKMGQETCMHSLADEAQPKRQNWRSCDNGMRIFLFGNEKKRDRL
jgi:hypothetical protein